MSTKKKLIVLFINFLLIVSLSLCINHGNTENLLDNTTVNRDKSNYIFEIILEHEIIISKREIMNPAIETRIFDSDDHQTVLDYNWDFIIDDVTLESIKYSDFSHNGYKTGTWDFNGTIQNSTVSLKLFFTLETNNTYQDPNTNSKDLVSEEYLLPSEGIWSDDPSIIELSNNIVQEDDNDLEKLEKIYTYVSELDYIETGKSRGDAIKSLERGGGDCEDKTFLLCALLRAQNIPARPVMGFIYGEKIAHTWAEVYLEKWITVDPTNMHLFFLPARYIKLSSGKGYYDLITFHYETNFPEEQIVKINYLKFQIKELTDFD